MDITDAIFTRRTVRKFKDRKVPLGIIKDILRAGLHAPSSCNQQMYYFILVDDPAIREKLIKECGFSLLKRIPTPIFVIADKRFGADLFANIQSAAAAMQNMLLYAHSLGLGGVWACGVGDRGMVKKLLSVPKNYHLVGCLGLGYPDEVPLKPVKRNAEEVLFFDKFTEPNPLVCNPDKWKLREIFDLSARAIFAHSPDIGYKPLFPREVENEVAYISQHLGDDVLTVYEVSGTHLFELARKNPNKNFMSLCYSPDMRKWFRQRAKFLHLDNLSFRLSSLADLESKSFDSVLFLELANRIPSSEIPKIIVQAKRVLRKDGNLIVSLLNRYSLYGLLFNKGVCRRFGPEKSLSPFKLMDILKSKGLKIYKRIGFNLLPSPKLFFKIGVPGKYTIFNKYLRLLVKYDLLEGSVNGWPLSNFCTTNIIFVRTKDD